MTKHTNALPPKLQAWVKARNRHGLSHAQVQMARELGLNRASPEPANPRAGDPREQQPSTAESQC